MARYMTDIERKELIFRKAENFIKAVDYDIVYKVGMEFFYRFGIDGIRKITFKN